MYKITLKDNLGYLIAEEYEIFCFVYAIKIRIKNPIYIQNKEFEDCEWVKIPKNFVEEIIKIKEVELS